MNELELSVRRICSREPRALFDRSLLEGMVYEAALGREKSQRVSLGYCRDNFRRLCLPSPDEIARAARKVVHTWEEG